MKSSATKLVKICCWNHRGNVGGWDVPYPSTVVIGGVTGHPYHSRKDWVQIKLSPFFWIVPDGSDGDPL